MTQHRHCAVRAFALAALLGSASAHLDAFCTCTDTALPGTISFYLGTYHSTPGAGRSVPGQVHIQAPSGAVQSFDFNNFRADGQRNSNDGPTMAANLKRSWGMTSSTSCNCYGNRPNLNTGGSVTIAEVMRPGGLTDLGCSKSNIRTWYKATLTRAVSGTYLVHTSGTDQNLNPWSPRNSVCAFTSARKLVLDLTVADGLAGCDGYPTAAAHSNGVPVSCKNVPSGTVCPLSCQGGFFKSGEAVCRNGAWENSFACGTGVACFARDVAAHVGIANAAGVTGAGCGFSTAHEQTCTLGCVTGMSPAPASGEQLKCFNGRWAMIASGVSCIKSPPTPPPTPAHPCENGTHGCDRSVPGHTCHKVGAVGTDYTCACKKGYWEMTPHNPPHTTHACALITPAPTPPPTPAPTPGCSWNTCSGMASCGGEMTCSSSGDPHMHMFYQGSTSSGTTTSGGHPQGNGAYVFAESIDKSFVVQVCHRPVNGQVSVNSAAAVKWGKHVLKHVGGSWRSVPVGVSCSTNTCSFPSGEVVSMRGGSVFVRFPASYCGSVQGMCGRYSPDHHFKDAYSSSSGRVIDVSTASGQRYQWGGPFWGRYQSQFVESFKAGSSETLFAASECSSSPTVVPAVIKASFADWPHLLADAIRECPTGPRYNDCLMDVGATGDLRKWVKAAEDSMPPPDFAPPPPTPKPTPAAPPAPTPAPCAFDSCAAMSACASSMRCSSSGDPHVTMFSGKYSHPQGAGPFVLAQSADKSFVVQTCHLPIGSGSVSINKALAIKTPQGVLKYTDGNWDVGSTGITCPGGLCAFPGGEKVAAVGSSVWVELPSRYCSRVSGLCGTFNPAANYADTYTTADGTVASFSGSPQWGAFQEQFVQSYALDSAASLFTAAECPAPAVGQPLPQPTVPFAACPLLKAVAEAQCPKNSRYAGCVADVGASCDLSWVADAQITPPGDLGARPTPPPTPAGSRCAPGTFFDGALCLNCAPGQYQAASGQYGCNFCAPGTFAASGASSCTDHKQCTSPATLNGAGEFESKAAHAHHDRECAPLTMCGAFQFVARKHTATGDRKCQDCPAGYKGTSDRSGCFIYSCSHMTCHHKVHTCHKFNLDRYARAPHAAVLPSLLRNTFSVLRSRRGDASNECDGVTKYQTIIVKHQRFDTTCTKGKGHYCAMGAASKDATQCECVPLSLAPAHVEKGEGEHPAAELGWTHHTDAKNPQGSGLAPAGTETRQVAAPVKYQSAAVP